MKTIEKKILPEYFDAAIRGVKNFELRKDEDDAEPEDVLLLKEWNGKTFTGRETGRMIQYVLRDAPEYGLMPGFCILGW